MSERRGNPHYQRRIQNICTATAVIFAGGVVIAPQGNADPDLSLDEAKTQVEALYHKAEQATERYNAATDELDEVKRRVDQVRSSVSRQEDAVEKAQRTVADFAAASYRVGSFDPTLRTIFAENPNESLSQASVVDAYASQQTDRLNAVTDERRSLENTKLLAEEELERLKAVEQTLDKEKATIEDHLDDAQEILDGLEAEELERLREEQEKERQENLENLDRGDEDDSDQGSDDQDDEGQGNAPAPSGGAQAVVDFAMAQMGEPYSWGATGPGSWDCSGLTLKAWEQAGVSLPRSSSSQINAGTRVSKGQLQPGDLVFYYSPISHVGIYIGNGKIVHATHPGSPVSVDPLNSMPFAGATRPS